MAAPFAQVKRCNDCRKPKPRDDFHKDSARRDGCQSKCKACSTAYERRRWADNREALSAVNRRQYAENRAQRLEVARQYGADLKAAVLAYYGTVCACCGGTEDLTVDHIEGDGREWREATFGKNKAGGACVYRWIIANGFPDGLQILCRPCNRSKGTGSRCEIDHATAVSGQPLRRRPQRRRPHRRVRT